MVEQQALEELRFFTCTNNAPTISVQNQGIFSLATHPLVIVIPDLEHSFSPDHVMSLATLGTLVFRDPRTLMSQASAIGLNLSSDSTADLIAVYAQDQHLGYLISFISILVLGFASFFSIFVSTQLYATSRLHSLFPLYISGTRISRLIRSRLIIDAFFIGCGVGIAFFLSSPLLLDVPAIFSIVCGAPLLVASILIRHHITRTTLIRACHRKS